MADERLIVTLRFSEIDKFRALIWELRMLCDRMRVEASPHADALEHALDRFTDSGEDADRLEDETT